MRITKRDGGTEIACGFLRSKHTGSWAALAMFAVSTLTTPQFVSAQAVYGSVFGTVTDSTGAAIPGATVTVADVSKGTSVNVQSDASGNYRVEHLIPDIYTVAAEATAALFF